MHKFIMVLVLVVSVAILESTCAEMLMPPERPDEFKSPTELRKYLKALNEYYAIVGRPRFGKRTSGSRSADFFRPNGEASAEDGAVLGDYF